MTDIMMNKTGLDDLISVIIPVYNTEKYLSTCIESVIKQSYKNIEIIIVNDGSTDSSSTLCEKFLVDSRVTLYHNRNIGLSKTRQYGIEHCHGKYFVTIDSDDYIHEDYIKELYHAIIINQADIAVCNRYDFIDGDDQFQIARHNADGYRIITRSDIYGSYAELCVDFGMSDSWDKMYRTEFVRDTGVIFSLDNKYNGTDLMFNYKLLLHCPKIVAISDPLLFHRILSGSRVHKKDKPMQEGFELIIKELYTETKVLEYTNDIYKQISVLFNKFIVVAISDAIQYSDSIFDAYMRLVRIHSRYKKYIFENEYLSSNYMISYSRLNSITNSFLKHKSPPWLLYVTVFRIKQIVIGGHNEKKFKSRDC